MRKLAAIMALAVALGGCAGGDEQPDPNAPPPETPEGQQQESQAEEEQPSDVAPIKQYKDLEEYAGQVITVEGIFKIYPKFKGRHGMIVLDGGLVIHVPHAEMYWRGENWWLHEGKRCRVTGMLHTYVSHPIDGMNGPFLDNPTMLTPVDERPKPVEEGEPKQAVQGNQ
jgi:hypothetical protein